MVTTDKFKKIGMNKAIGRSLLTVATVSMLLMSSCDTKKPVNNSTTGMAKIVCDDSFENIMSQEINVFEYTYPDANIMPYYVNENAALDSLLQRKTRLAITSNTLSDEQIEYLRKKQGTCIQQRIAVDAIAVIVNNNNTVDSLSMSQLREMLSGQKMLWPEFGYKRGDSINVVFDNAGSSIVKYMKNRVLDGGDFTSRIFAQGTNKGVFDIVEKNINAVGIIGVSWISHDMSAAMTSLQEEIDSLTAESTDTIRTEFVNSIKVLKIYEDGATHAYKPYQAYIYDGSYPLYRNIYAICTSGGGSLTHGFFTFITGFIGQKIIMQTGVLPSTVHPRMVNLY